MAVRGHGSPSPGVVVGRGVAAFALAPLASASRPLDSGATGISLEFNSKGAALITYTA
jgi:hypothetical protein